MKLLIVTAAQEYKEAIAHIFHDTRLYQYSVALIHGINNENADSRLDNWFGRTGTESFSESVMMLCFTGDNSAGNVLTAIKDYNDNNQPDFPVKAWLLPVSASI